jgi:hypothetical protein
MTLCIVSSCCPTGCGVPVVILQARTNRTLFCYCNLCGCAWSSPREAQFESGLNAINRPEAFAPDGVDLPPRAEIAEPGWLAAIVEELPDSDWAASLRDINRAITARASVR